MLKEQTVRLKLSCPELFIYLLLMNTHIYLSSEQATNLVSALFKTIGSSNTLNRLRQHNWSSYWHNHSFITVNDRIQSKCYGGLGCITYNKSWYHSIYRPFNHFPLESSVLNTSFIIQNREHRFNQITLSAYNRTQWSEQLSHFNWTRKCVILIHGFLDTGTDNWLQEMSQQLLDAENLNIISIDWNRGALSVYSQAIANSRLVAMETVQLIQFLKRNFSLELNQLHLIGHSLGAHIAGYIGKHVGAQSLRRITGLDPAQPGFQYMPECVRLHYMDAKFVDIIHTDGRSILAGGFGMIQACGHADFYPNGGRQQPGCSTYSSLSALAMIDVDDLEAELFACRHTRSIRYYTDSIRSASDCSYIAYPCSSYKQFTTGICLNISNNRIHQPVVMGYHIDKFLSNKVLELTNYYLTTNAKSPFCVFHYQVIIHSYLYLGLSSTGKFILSMFGSKNVLDHNLLPAKGSIKLSNEQQSMFLIRSTRWLGDISRVSVAWMPEMSFSCLIWCSNEAAIQVMSVRVTYTEITERSIKTVSIKLCAASKNSTETKPGKNVILFKNEGIKCK